MNETTTKQLCDQLQHVEYLYLGGYLQHFSLDSFVGLNLKGISIRGFFCQDFNFELLKNLSRQLEYLSINAKCNYEQIVKLLDGHDFSNITGLDIRNSDIKRLEKKFIERFPNLEIIRMSACNLENIEEDVFSNSQKIFFLNLRENLFNRLCKRDFSQLVNLRYFEMSKNRIESIEDGFFSNMKSLEFIKLGDNQLVLHDLDVFDCDYLQDTVYLYLENNQLFLKKYYRSLNQTLFLLERNFSKKLNN